jgi:hypothetical protein
VIRRDRASVLGLEGGNSGMLGPFS